MFNQKINSPIFTAKARKTLLELGELDWKNINPDIFGSMIQAVATYKVYNRNADKLESLLHRFFANACLDIDLFNEKGQRLKPREWFVIPFEVIKETIQLILNKNILNYQYDPMTKKLN